MTRSENRPTPNEGSFDWHIEQGFEILERDFSDSDTDRHAALSSLMFIVVSRSREYLGASHKEVFDAFEEIRELFYGAWMEEAEDETKH